MSMTLFASGVAVMGLGMLGLEPTLCFIGLGVSTIGYLAGREASRV